LGLGLGMKLKTDGAQALFTYWERLKQSARLPSTADLDLVDIAPILANIMVYEKIDDDFSIRFFGTELVRRIGIDLTGTNMSLYQDDPLCRLTVNHLNQVLDGPLILAAEFNAGTNEGPVLEIEQIMVPIADKNGAPLCVLSHATRTKDTNAIVTLELTEGFKGLIGVQTLNL